MIYFGIIANIATIGDSVYKNLGVYLSATTHFLLLNKRLHGRIMSADVKRQMFEMMASQNGHGFRELKASILPPKLYKYASINEYTIDALTNSYLWVGPVHRLNDPWDSKVGFDVKADDEEMAKIRHHYILHFAVNKIHITVHEFAKLFLDENPLECLEEIVRKSYSDKTHEFLAQKERIEQITRNHQQLLKSFNYNINNNVKICSLSEVNDIMPMWSHYSSNHSGVCIEYEIDKFREPDLVQFYPVHYQAEFIDAGKYLRERMDIPLICILASICKKIDWSYEKEWRFVEMTIGPGRQQKTPQPSAIYFGSECNLDDKRVKEIITIANERGIPKRIMIKSESQYVLHPKPFD